ncbi:HAD family hydrolase [Streptomyces pristinaespiralis]|uniref:Hydrolase n=2 Tax=Streptomyces pristinaespiralis TaxID=38300 RepID=A0A0M4DYW9_STRPR|nr:HAD-IA family hydrolase [Streptomyces pristinaespiralis]ALC25175.1 hydrolase [Streptomyces pristinaespiralis]QMU12582.1 HAD-IA family hydrolase [Streptomyces pristinaespiralis]
MSGSRWRGVDAVVLDTDGVITDSAKIHAAAWKTAFDACLLAHPPDDPAARRPFDVRDDYLRHVDGRSRQDGAAAFLASRGLRLPRGSPDDSPGTDTVGAVAAYKEQLFTRRLSEQGIDAYPGTARLLRMLRARAVPLAAVSASRHARELITRAGVLPCFDVLVDGAEAARLRLPGKPEPALFLEAARRLGVPPDRTAVVEDALAGVEAGRRGGFALVIGVDRTGGPGTGDALLEHGADLVVRDLAELLPAGTDGSGEPDAPPAPPARAAPEPPAPPED